MIKAVSGTSARRFSLPFILQRGVAQSPFGGVGHRPVSSGIRWRGTTRQVEASSPNSTLLYILRKGTRTKLLLYIHVCRKLV
jgi:hypothetical protein